MSGASGTGVAPAQRYVPVCQLGGSFCVDGPDSTRVSESGTRLVTGTDFVTQPVQDYEAASKFYGETLGLEFSKRWGKMPAGEFETGSLTIRPDAARSLRDAVQAVHERDRVARGGRRGRAC